MHHNKFYIAGKWVEPQSEDRWPLVNPATEQVVAHIPMASEADVNAAVAAAKAAFPSYSQTTVSQRIQWFKRLLDIYRANADAITDAMIMEIGCPRSFTHEVQTPCGDGHIEVMIEVLESFQFEHPSPRGGSTIVHEPVGVCALITPWNWPINQVVAKVLPSLASGCTCVLKPSEESALSAILFAQMLDEAGFPAGAFNLINGNGEIAGNSMSAHPDIELVSFTGSTRAGKLVQANGVETVKRVVLELGGKSANILFADADIDAAVAFSADACFSNAGQTCDAPTRLLIERSVYTEVKAKLMAATQATQLGDPQMEGDHIGPVVNQRQFEQIQQKIQAGIDEGAVLLAGGPGRPEGLDTGFYIRPTLFEVDPAMRVNQEEIFGPVLCIMPFDTEEQAIALANDSVYGLGAYVQTLDIEKAQRVARQLRAGNVSINGAAYDYDVPFGGTKQSGNGRENGVYGLHDFLDIKAIAD
ncbi:MAG: aldehyde dehydrogenase family protein [Porticoccaceae bacterium]|jgi:aldehyde dehydrogenase (NAD+)|nr:aldehyde dehydrogenase family protein [Porticoccaceae bacterium]MBT7257966.1 aldehyde dehydrogenase family protein [Porticoccaceae bacterium]MDA9839430.1 aldehyde dehydrogenase family protein [Porticoccaceae bacterium]